MRNEKEVMRYVQTLIQDIQELSERIDHLLTYLENGETMSLSERRIPLVAAPSYFKGKKPVSILFPDGREIEVTSWKNTAFHLLRNCAEDDEMRKKLEGISGKIFGRNRLILGSSGDGMNIPLEFYPGLFLESKFDTEMLLTVITKKIFEPIGYDYSGIHLKVTDPMLEISAQDEADESFENKPAEESLDIKM